MIPPLSIAASLIEQFDPEGVVWNQFLKLASQTIREEGDFLLEALEKASSRGKQRWVKKILYYPLEIVRQDPQLPIEALEAIIHNQELSPDLIKIVRPNRDLLGEALIVAVFYGHLPWINRILFWNYDNQKRIQLIFIKCAFMTGFSREEPLVLALLHSPYPPITEQEMLSFFQQITPPPGHPFFEKFKTRFEEKLILLPDLLEKMEKEKEHGWPFYTSLLMTKHERDSLLPLSKIYGCRWVTEQLAPFEFEMVTQSDLTSRPGLRQREGVPLPSRTSLSGGPSAAYESAQQVVAVIRKFLPFG